MTLRRYYFHLLPVVLILLLLNAPLAFAQFTEHPTSEDRALASTYSTLVAGLIAADSPARELINERAPERIQAYLDTLNAKTQVASWELRRARRYMRRILPQLEGIKTLAPPTPYSIARRQGMITVDGKLEEEAWQHATAMPIPYNHLEKVEGPPATVRLLWDETYLYAAFEVPDANIIAPPIARDGEVWKTDVPAARPQSPRLLGA